MCFSSDVEEIISELRPILHPISSWLFEVENFIDNYLNGSAVPKVPDPMEQVDLNALKEELRGFIGNVADNLIVRFEELRKMYLEFLSNPNADSARELLREIEMYKKMYPIMHYIR